MKSICLIHQVTEILLIFIYLFTTYLMQHKWFPLKGQIRDYVNCCAARNVQNLDHADIKHQTVTIHGFVPFIELWSWMNIQHFYNTKHKKIVDTFLSLQETLPGTKITIYVYKKQINKITIPSTPSWTRHQSQSSERTEKFEICKIIKCFKNNTQPL